MAFKITARTLLHLGAELISSDAIALYELIKNAFDAGSTAGVHIEVNIRLKSWPGVWPTRLSALIKRGSTRVRLRGDEEDDTIQKVKSDLLADLDPTAPDAAKWAERVRDANDAEELQAVAGDANEIIIRDTGHGMSKADLNEVYLTIGTRYRREERESQRERGDNARAILGEK
jgi:HSP90 family molecular chaperone